jgi:hypothetical protein
MHPRRLGILAALLAAVALMLSPAGAQAHAHHARSHPAHPQPVHHHSQAAGIEPAKPSIGRVEATLHAASMEAAATILASAGRLGGTQREPGPSWAASADPGASGPACLRGCSHAGGHGCCVAALPSGLVMVPPMPPERLAADSVERAGITPEGPSEPPRSLAPGPEAWAGREGA